MCLEKIEKDDGRSVMKAIFESKLHVLDHGFGYVSNELNQVGEMRLF